MAVDKLLAGYETIWGTKKALVIDHYGPASYSAGGETVSAKQFGWGGIDFATSCGISASGTYFPRVIPQANSTGLSGNNFNVKWFIAANGAEAANAANLSAETCRLLVIGV